MSELHHDPPGDTTRSTWGAIAWAEGFLVAALAFATFALASSIESCDILGGCGPEESSLGAASVVWLVLAGMTAVTGLVAAALRSGWSRDRSLLHVALALAGGAGTLVAGAMLSKALFDEYTPGLVAAVGVAGTLAIRPPAPRATRARAVAIGVAFLLALVLANGTLALVVLLLAVLPALGLADSLSTPARRIEPETEA